MSDGKWGGSNVNRHYNESEREYLTRLRAEVERLTRGMRGCIDAASDITLDNPSSGVADELNQVFQVLVCRYDARGQEVKRLRKLLFSFAELPTVGYDDAVDLDVYYQQLVSNRMIIDARAALSSPAFSPAVQLTPAPCARCKGSREISVKVGLMFETDSTDEVRDAYRYRSRPCPVCASCKACPHVQHGNESCQEYAPHAQFRCGCRGVCEHGKGWSWCTVCNPPAQERCKVNRLSSRICERGTKGCVVDHGTSPKEEAR